MKTFTTLTFILVFSLCSTVMGQWEVLNEGGSFRTIEFVNDEVGWIMGDGILYKTEDGGDTWYEIPLSWMGDIDIGNTYIYGFDFYNESVGYATFGDEILKSTDGGVTWIFLKKNIGIDLYDLQALNDSTVYFVGYHEGSSIFLKTNDGGENWEENHSFEQQRKYQTIWFQSPNDGILIGTEYDGPNPNQGSILHTNDGGITWREQLTTDFHVMNILQVIDDSTAYFKAERDYWEHSIYKSMDTLYTWSTVYKHPHNIHSLYCLNDTTLYAIMRDDTSLYFNKSSDGGITWHSRRPVPFHYGTYNLFFKNNNIGYLIGQGLGSYISYTMDGGNEWYIEQFDMPILDIFLINKNKGFVCGGGTFWGFGSKPWGKMFATENGGKTWIEKLRGLVFKVIFINPLIGYTLSWGGGGWWTDTHIHKTTDGGITWNKISIDIYDNYGFFWDDIGFFDENNFYVIGHYHSNSDSIPDGAGIVYSKNGGVSGETIWKRSHTKNEDGTTDLFYQFNSVFTIGTKAWVVGSHGLLLCIENPDSVRVIEDLTDIPLGKIFFSDSKHGWISGGDSLGTLLKTTDGGETWNEITKIGHETNDMFFEDSIHGWIVGCDINERGVILESSDGGKHWNIEVENLSAPLNAIAYKEGYLWVAGGDGLILKSDITTDIWIDEKNNKIYPTKYSLNQNYPNPFNPLTTIEFNLPKSEFVELKVYNILGKKVATVVDDKLKAGNHSYEFDGSKLASGIYLYRIEAGNWQEVKKMILLK